MASLADEFARSRYQPEYEFMARVEGIYQKTPFVGSVGNDTHISDAVGRVLHIHLDLPIKINGVYRDHIFAPKRDFKKLQRRPKWTT